MTEKKEKLPLKSVTKKYKRRMKTNYLHRVHKDLFLTAFSKAQSLVKLCEETKISRMTFHLFLTKTRCFYPKTVSKLKEYLAREKENETRK